MSQTTVTRDPVKLVAGQIAETDEGAHTRSATADEDIQFGLGVVRTAQPAGGPADDIPVRAALPTAAADITDGTFIGVAQFQTTREKPVGAAVSTGYAADDEMPVVERGIVAVDTEGAVTWGDDVFVRFAAGGGGSQPGAFRNDADTATAAKVPNAKYVSTLAAAGRARVKLV